MEISTERTKNQLTALLRNNANRAQRNDMAAANCTNPELKQYLRERSIEFQKFDFSFRMAIEDIFGEIEEGSSTNLRDQSRSVARIVQLKEYDSLLLEKVILGYRADVAQYDYIMINSNIPDMLIQKIEMQKNQMQKNLCFLKQRFLLQVDHQETPKVIPEIKERFYGIDRTVDTINSILFN